MEQSRPWAANHFSTNKEIPPHLMEHEGSLLHS